MPTLVKLNHVEPDCNAPRDLWRLLTADNVGHCGATAGLAEYHPAADGNKAQPPVLGAAHERPEIYHVLAGTGNLHAPGQVHPLAAGDTFLIPGGVPHTIVGTGGALRAFSVSLKEPEA